jgi:hypothetical protein
LDAGSMSYYSKEHKDTKWHLRGLLKDSLAGEYVWVVCMKGLPFQPMYLPMVQNFVQCSVYNQSVIDNGHH